MMLVDPAWRRQGIGQALMRQALDHLCGKRHPVRTFGCDSSTVRHFTHGWGFEPQFQASSLCRLRQAMPAEAKAVARAARPGHGRSRQLGPTNRRLRSRTSLAGLVADRRGSLRVRPAGESLAGYAMRRPGRVRHVARALRRGVTRDGTRVAAAHASMQWIHPVFVDVPDDNDVAIATVTHAGLQPVRVSAHGPGRRTLSSEWSRLFASSGPETG